MRTSTAGADRRGAVAPAGLDDLQRAMTPHGLILRGGFRPTSEDSVPEGTGTLILVGNAGPAMWRAFASHPPSPGPDPLNRWIAAIIRPLAERCGARPLFPSDGPPYWPFQRWATRAEPVFPSPLGILIHPRWGLWHAYRSALAFPTEFPLLAKEPGVSPCATCAAKPCLESCPVEAFSGASYVVVACRAHIGAPAGADCMGLGCRARRACPIGRDFAYEPAQAGFHMAAFARA